MRIFLEFSAAQDPVCRARIAYAFRLFSAIYDHQPLFTLSDAASADLCLSYSDTPKSALPRLRLNTSPVGREHRSHAPRPTSFVAHRERTVLIHQPSPGKIPDWLGEIFEWVSCADEYSVDERDSVGRVRFDRSYAGRYQLDTTKPYAGIAMRLLQQDIQKLHPGLPLTPLSPAGNGRHAVVNTHDVDFVPSTKLSSIRRLAKNSVISLVLHKSSSLAAKQLQKSASLAVGGGNPLEQVIELAVRERELSLSSTFFFLTQRIHRRDANYSSSCRVAIDLMKRLEDMGMEIGVHGSYTSLDDSEGLAREFCDLRGLGFQPAGERQHWLRFTLDRLIAAFEKTDAFYDTSLGWSDRIGFRAGACFAFPPYDFRQERPAAFLEIPLIAMDQALLRVDDREEGPVQAMQKLLGISKYYGWGGISVLWHPTAFDQVQLPESIGTAFWQLVQNGRSCNEQWVTGRDFVRGVWQRYQEVGLLQQNGPSL
jgi:hypothetical protein